VNVLLKNYNRAFLAVIVFAIFLVFIRPYFFDKATKPVKQLFIDGEISLEAEAILHHVFELDGLVDFYPNQFWSAEQLLDDTILKKESSIQFPSSWGTKEQVYYGTYHFVISGLTPGKSYGFHMMDAFTSFEIEVDDKVILSNGVVGTQKSESIPESDPGIGLFVANNSTIDVVIRVSNFASHLYGVWQKTVFGLTENIVSYEEKLLQRDLIVIASLWMMALYHWILYAIMRKEKTILYFSLFILMVLIKSYFSGIQLGYEWYIPIPYIVGMRLAYIVIPFMAITFIAFVKACFPEEVPEKFSRLNKLISGIQVIVIVFFPQKFFQGTFFVYQLYLVFVFVSIMYFGIKSVIHRRQGSRIYSMGFAFFFLVAMNDILYSLQWIRTGFYLGVGLFVLILSQASVIAIRFSNALETEAKLKNNLENIVVERTEQLNYERNMFEHLSKVDSLTHLYNKRFLTEALSIEFEGHKRYQGVFSLIMIDLDHFKQVNDNYGHLVGDEVLIHIAGLLAHNTRRTDIVGRFGGEEFLLLMRFTSLESAIIHANNLREAIESSVIDTQKGTIRMTASFGVTQIDPMDISEIDVLSRADEALYIAKHKGRNQVASRQL